MQRLAIRILSLALIAVSSAAAVGTKYPNGVFEPRLDKLQDLLAHIRTVEKIKVKAGPKLWQAIATIPVRDGPHRDGRPHHPRARSRPARLALRLSRRLLHLRQ